MQLDTTLYARWRKTQLYVTYVINGEGAPQVMSSNLEEIARMLVDPADYDDDVYVWLESVPLARESVPEADAKALVAQAGELGAKEGVWFDLSLNMRVGEQCAVAAQLREVEALLATFPHIEARGNGVACLVEGRRVDGMPA